jgi:hypothetical protein
LRSIPQLIIQLVATSKLGRWTTIASLSVFGSVFAIMFGGIKRVLECLFSPVGDASAKQDPAPAPVPLVAVASSAPAAGQPRAPSARPALADHPKLVHGVSFHGDDSAEAIG